MYVKIIHQSINDNGYEYHCGFKCTGQTFAKLKIVRPFCLHLEDKCTIFVYYRVVADVIHEEW